jgi:hypothetical protein
MAWKATLKKGTAQNHFLRAECIANLNGGRRAGFRPIGGFLGAET